MERVEFIGLNENFKNRGRLRPTSGHLPMWYGGHHEKTLPRIAKWGDGWIMNNFRSDQTALDILGELRRMLEAEGRDPRSVGIEVRTSCGLGGEADRRAEAAFWKAAGVTHLRLTTAFDKRYFHRSGGKHLGDHLAAT